MAYLALYRAFRPNTLNGVVRQEHVVTILKNQIETGRVGHAYLFCGPRGTGKTSVAKIFAAAINCENPQDGSPCGKCAACRALADPSNLDISEIDAASNNGVDEMRDLREKVQYPPVGGRYKVYIVDEAHMLSAGAFNALLKTLEEPPAHAVFILATTEAQKIPATILSRCMRFDFKLIPQEDLENLLRSVLKKIGKEYEEEAVSAIARAGAGSARDCLSLADTCVSFSSGKLTYEDVISVLGSADFEGIGELCSACLSGDTGGAIRTTEKLLAEGKSISNLLKDAMNFLNACVVAKTCRDAKKILALSDSAFAQVTAAAQATDGHGLLRACEIFSKAENDLKFSVAPRIVFETAAMKIAVPQTDYGIEGLLARVSALEKKLEAGTFSALPVEQKTSESVPEKKEAKKPELMPVAEEEEFPVEAPPDEDETGGNVYFDVGFKAETEKKVPVEPAPVSPIKVSGGDAKALFGGFLRALRKQGKNGVLFTICMDLESGFDEDGVFTLYTVSDTVYNSLQREEHKKILSAAFEAAGVSEYAVKKQAREDDAFKKNTETLKARFPNVKIEIK